MLPTLVGAAILVFFLLRAIPGDVCEVRLAGSGLYVDEAEIELCREKLGLAKPLIAQFFDFITGYFTWNLGDSMWTGKPVTEEIGIRFPLSLQVAIMATVVAVVFAIPLGAISAIKQDTWIDYAVRTFSIAGIAIGTQHFFGTPWMPPIDYVSVLEDPMRNLSQLIWPAVATGYRYSAVATRMTRSALLEVLREDYIRTARAKGMVEKIIINRHALKNSMLPVLTIIGIEFAFLMGGLVVTEQVFNLNGIGKLFVESVQAQDFAMTQQLVMLVVLIALLTNFVVDLIYAWLDPRIRYS